MKKELIKKELAVYGIYVEDDYTCRYFESGEEQSSSIDELLSFLEQEVKRSRISLTNLWEELLGALTLTHYASAGGSDACQKMFIKSIKRLWRLSYGAEFSAAKTMLKKILLTDVNRFSERYMSKVVDYTLCITWMFRIIRHDRFRIHLLNEYIPKKEAAYNDNFGNPGESGSVSVPEGDRVVPGKIWFDEEEDEKKNSSFWQQLHRRYECWDDEDWEDGFHTEDQVYRSKNAPFLFNDINEESNINEKTKRLSIQG